MPSFEYRQEVYRKLIHLSSLWMVFAIYFFEKSFSLGLFALGTGMILLYEGIRRQENAAALFLKRTLGSVLRPEEEASGGRLSGAVYVLVAAFVSTLLFPTIIAMTAMMMMLLGDAAAALVGRKFGRTKILGKSLEGSCAFFLTSLAGACLIALAVPVSDRYFPAAIAAAAAAVLMELISSKIRIDDNFSVPLVAGAVMLLVM